MPIKSFNCRGEECRKNIVKRYDLKLIAHTKLLNGQSKKSCAGVLLTDTYYTFEYKDKTNKLIEGSFFCGHVVAKNFMELANITPIPIFNPLSIERGDNESEETASNEESSSKDDYKKKWNPIAKQLYNAINLIIVCWNTPIYGKLARFKSDLLKYKYAKPYLDRIKFVNDVIAKDSKKRTLTQMLVELRVQNPTLKHFDFQLLFEELKAFDVESNF